MEKLICLTDNQKQSVYFEPSDLMDQVFAAGLITLQGAPKAAALNLARKVREMREWQKRYFAAAHGSNEKQTALNRSKQAEKAIDELLPKFLQTVPNLQ